MKKLDGTKVAIGYELPEYRVPAISRTTLALFAGASGDHNPIHIDIDFAREAGFDDVFAHGMLGMAYLAQLLTKVTEQKNIQSYKVRFNSITQIGAALKCSGTVINIEKIDGKKTARIELKAFDQYDDLKLLGEAVVKI